ncbi:Na-translocating system protein MpsC family protein [Thalassorhabdus alkalitolerans]|uniref:Na-translocating system protein MpsC family protein n=1 Tax=Thalassorhabdus alkalitolerans TaxID=2282697 RepID=A0ABW0YN85_9BACI
MPHSTAQEKSMKKTIAQIYNKVNQEMYGLGVRKQKIEVLEDKIIIFGLHKRVQALHAIGQKHPELTLSVDYTLIQEFKERLKKELGSQLNLKVKTILKDFDPKSEEAVAVIYLTEKQ